MSVLRNGLSRFSFVSVRRVISGSFVPTRALAVSPAKLENSAWKLGPLNHVAIVVPDLEKAASMYRNVLGAHVSDPQDLPEHGVTVVFVNLGNTKLELLRPLGENSPVANFLEKNKSGGMHHVCIEVDNIEKAMEDLKQKKIRLLSDKPKIGAHGNNVVFLHPKDCNGVLTELEEV